MRFFVHCLGRMEMSRSRSTASAPVKQASPPTPAGAVNRLDFWARGIYARLAMAKQRLDSLLVSRGLAPSQEKAQAIIMAGEVVAGGRGADKPGGVVAEDVPLDLMER